MQTPLVSVLMTAYNREKYIADAIESVLASTFTNFELIIVDDGSKDNTVGIAKNYAEKDDRIKICLNEINLGDYPNRNKAASYAKGKYIKYVDADDYLYPNGLAVLVEMMEQFPEAAFGLCSLTQVRDEPYPFMLNSRQAYYFNYFGPGLFHKAPLSSIIKKDVFDKLGGFKNLRMLGDFEMWHRMASQFPVVLMPDGIVWYREHDEQESILHHKFAIQYEKVRWEYLTDKNCPLEKKDSKAALRNRKKTQLYTFFNNVIRFKFSFALINLKILKYQFQQKTNKKIN